MKKCLVVLALIFIQGCSSGGEESTATAIPITSFSLFPSNYFTSYDKTMNLSGSDNAGSEYTVMFSEKTGSETTFLGVPAIPVLTQVQITNTATGGLVNVTLNQYYTTSASDRHYLGNDSDTSTVSAITTAIPQSVVIGSSGVVGTYTDNAGDVESQSWRLDDGDNGKAEQVTLFSTKDQSGETTGSETQTFLIDESGNRLSVTLVIYYADSGVTLTLSGS